MENVQAPWIGEPPEEPNPVRTCDWCNKPMYEGDAVYYVDDDWYGLCEDCAQKYLEDNKEIL